MKKSGCLHHLHAKGRKDRQKILRDALEVLKTRGHKLTKPRRAVLETMATSSGPMTTEEVFTAAKVRLKATRCDLVTVYRSLATFSELRLLSKLDFGDGVVRYEWMESAEHHHHHFVCDRCRRVEPLTGCEIETQEAILQRSGYTRLSHRLEFFGLCPDCSAKAP